jgi:hypothetical protein
LRIILFIFAFIQLGISGTASGQDDSSSIPRPSQLRKDSLPIVDSVLIPVPKKKKSPKPPVKPDSLIIKRDTANNLKANLASLDTTRTRDSISTPIQISTPAVSKAKQEVLPVEERVIQSKDWLFYTVMALLLFLALLRIRFSKYFTDMFRIFWHTSFRQKQIRDQLQQAALPSLLFNLFFGMSSSLFVVLIINEVRKDIHINHWLLLGLCFIIIMVIYLAKFFILKLAGWMFGQEEAAETYIFIVFLVNKIMSVLFLPLIIILAFGGTDLKSIALALSFLLLIFFLGYRFIRSYTTIRNELKISQLHFLLYICGFEIFPVLLIYKLLMELFERTL